MCAALPRSDYYEGSATSPGRQPTVDLPAARLVAGQGGRPEDASHVHCVPVDGGGIELYPDSIAVSTPQIFLTASRTAPIERRERAAVTE